MAQVVAAMAMTHSPGLTGWFTRASELLAWVLVLPFTRGPADVLTYMPAVAWRSGTGMVVWNELAR